MEKHMVMKKYYPGPKYNVGTIPIYGKFIATIPSQLY